MPEVVKPCVGCTPRGRKAVLRILGLTKDVLVESWMTFYWHFRPGLWHVDELSSWRECLDEDEDGEQGRSARRRKHVVSPSFRMRVSRTYWCV